MRSCCASGSRPHCAERMSWQWCAPSATSAPGPPSRSASHARGAVRVALHASEAAADRVRSAAKHHGGFRIRVAHRRRLRGAHCPAGTWGTKGAAQAFFRICTGTGVTLPESSVGNSRLGIRASPGQPDLRTRQWLVVGARCSLARKLWGIVCSFASHAAWSAARTNSPLGPTALHDPRHAMP